MVNYSSIIVDFEDELHRLIAERDKIQNKIARITTAVEYIQLLAQDSDEPIIQPPPMPPAEEDGFTDRVRAMLKANPLRTLSALEIRDSFVESSPHDDPKTMLIHIHNTLKRLFRQGEVEEHDLAEGRKGYKIKNAWIDKLLADSLSQLTKEQPTAPSTTPKIFRRRPRRKRTPRAPEQK